MDDWEAAFRDKSERRRRRSQRHHLLRRGALLAVIAALILLGLWAVDMLMHDVLGWL